MPVIVDEIGHRERRHGVGDVARRAGEPNFTGIVLPGVKTELSLRLIGARIPGEAYCELGRLLLGHGRASTRRPGTRKMAFP